MNFSRSTKIDICFELCLCGGFTDLITLSNVSSVSKALKRHAYKPFCLLNSTSKGKSFDFSNFRVFPLPHLISQNRFLSIEKLEFLNIVGIDIQPEVLLTLIHDCPNLQEICFGDSETICLPHGFGRVMPDFVSFCNPKLRVKHFEFRELSRTCVILASVEWLKRLCERDFQQQLIEIGVECSYFSVFGDYVWRTMMQDLKTTLGEVDSDVWRLIRRCDMKHLSLEWIVLRDRFLIYVYDDIGKKRWNLEYQWI